MSFTTSRVIREMDPQNASLGRFVLYSSEDRKIASAYVTFRKTENGEFDLEHTITDPQFRGQGLAEIVVKAAFEWADQHKVVVIPTCSYISGNFLKKNPQFQTQCKL
jgi:predicted GNAT family acetyltransferase